LTNLKRLGRQLLVRRYAVRELQPEVAPTGIESVVEADVGVEGRAYVLERRAAKFSPLGGTDQVRGDLKQRGLTFSAPMACILGAPTLADVEGYALVFA
jgi:hypothetical protein